MKFCWCTIKVNNLEESLKFYQDIVGLNLDHRFKSGPVEIAFMGNDETKLELLHDETANQVDMGQDISLGFEVESVDKMMAFLKEKGIAIHSGPIQPNPHVRFFFVLDPNGLKVQFVENIE
ncbi:VOC family protein [Dehalobacterium formicoaceticum]|uniref:VOC family protein n=1 Tax=Dehalobacterium formicoaceticum TaxID=51515 RepID=A0ABT1Y2Q9_9FIRM|nr:VOC family protein [Dehalobacterium formicoaceticum]MCR6544838.1 VOC family protein [Dehalobacterium formicoaceticum]